MKMKKVIAIVLAVMLMATLFVGCGEEATEGGKLAEIKAAGKLVMATDAAWPPFEYLGADGEIAGADVELGKYIAKELGVEFEVINVAFDNLPIYLVNGECDIVAAAMTVTEERKETMDFSTPYTVAQQYIIVPEDNTTVETVEDLAGYSIGVHLGTTGDYLVTDEVNGWTDDDGNAVQGVLQDTGATVKQYKSLTDATLAMKSGDLGAIVCDTQLAENLCIVNDGIKCFKLVYEDGSGTDEELAVAMAKGDAEFVAKVNEIVEKLKADGTFDQWIVTHNEISSALNEG